MKQYVDYVNRVIFTHQTLLARYGLSGGNCLECRLMLWNCFSCGTRFFHCARVPIRSADISHEFGILRTDYGVIDTGISHGNVIIPRPNIKVHRVIRLPSSHVLILAAHSMHKYLIPTNFPNNHNILTYPSQSTNS